ncbi:zinc-binding dehydrogenase [Streptomyces shenzhenensis]|uniref:zinc-binding dehydrogenase n=1 Tax=Streptomyces shenzhenensis TaxID=943815 RepID=UPI003402B6D5
MGRQCGGRWLTAVAAASSAGVASVVAVDLNRARREMAERFGASEVRSSTAGLKDCGTPLEFSGSSAALQEGLRALDVRGVAVLAGAVAPDADVTFDPELVVRRTTPAELAEVGHDEAAGHGPPTPGAPAPTR